MTSSEEPRGKLDESDETLVRRIAASYAPAKLEPAKRVALEEELWRRIEGRKYRRLLVPTLASAVAVLLAFFWLTVPWVPLPWTGGGDGQQDGQPIVVARARSQPVPAWEYELMASELEPTASEITDEAALPEDYQAIAVAFLDY